MLYVVEVLSTNERAVQPVEQSSKLPKVESRASATDKRLPKKNLTSKKDPPNVAVMINIHHITMEVGFED
jgi:hypothetical protein